MFGGTSGWTSHLFYFFSRRKLYFSSALSVRSSNIFAEKVLFKCICTICLCFPICRFFEKNYIEKYLALDNSKNASSTILVWGNKWQKHTPKIWDLRNQNLRIITNYSTVYRQSFFDKQNKKSLKKGLAISMKTWEVFFILPKRKKIPKK